MTIGIKDIAQRAGVSLATVSLVLNNKPGVGKETRKRVQEIVEELGYRSNTGGKVPFRQPGTIRFVVFHKHGKVVTDTPFFSPLIAAIDAESKKGGFRLVISYLTQEEFERELRLIKEEQMLSGIILLATEMEREDLQSFMGLSVPLVVVDSYFERLSLNHVVINNQEGVQRAVHHLAESGHRSLGYCASSVTINNFADRARALQQTAAELEMQMKPEHRFALEPTLEGSYRDMCTCLDEMDRADLPTALFADNDLIALGAMRALKERGIAIPQQISIIGFDDLPYCGVAEPPLTTIRVFNESLGSFAVQRLKEMIDYGAEPPITIQVSTQLTVRGSVDAPPTNG